MNIGSLTHEHMFTASRTYVHQHANICSWESPFWRSFRCREVAESFRLSI